MIDPIQALQKRFDLFIPRELPWAFFTGLTDYIDYILSIPDLKKIVDEQFAIRDAEYQKIAEFERRSLLEMRQAKKKLLSVIKENSIDVSIFSQDLSFIPIEPSGHSTIIEQMELWESGKVATASFMSDGLQHYLFDIAANLLKLGYREELKDFIVSSHEYAAYQTKINGPASDTGLVYGGNIYGNFIFSKTWPRRFQQVAAVETARETEPWGAFEVMMKFWKARAEVAKNADINQIIADCVSDKQYRFAGKDAVDVVYMANDLKTLIKEHGVADQELKHLHVTEMKTRITTVHLRMLTTESKSPDVIVRDAHRKNLRKKISTIKEEAWRSMVEGFIRETREFMEKTDAFMERWELEKQDAKKIGNSEMVRFWKDGDKPKLDEKTGEIHLGDKTCQIPLGATNQIETCNALFSKQFGSWMEEIEVINKFVKGDNSKRSLKDATRQINKRIKASFGIDETLEYGGKLRRVRIKSDLFEIKEV